jgi:hypothetical protein
MPDDPTLTLPIEIVVGDGVTLTAAYATPLPPIHTTRNNSPSQRFDI